MAGSTGLERTLVPEAQRSVSEFWQDWTDLQAPGGDGDLAPISHLHGVLDARDEATRRALDQAAVESGFTSSLERAARVEAAETETGRLVGVRRDAPAGQH
jgi:hypothetical protein